MQDVPAFGVGLQYAATLSSTKDIMQALQQAHQCRQGVLSGQAPILQAADCLPDLPTASGAEVISLHPSPDSKLMAVVYGGNWTWEIDGHTASEPEVCGLALYETHTGKLLHSLRDDDSSPCSVFWFPCSTRLYVQAYATDTRPFVTYDAVSRHIVPSGWSHQAAAAWQRSRKLAAVIGHQVASMCWSASTGNNTRRKLCMSCMLQAVTCLRQPH